MKVLHLDTNHPLLLEAFRAMGFHNEEDYHSVKEEVETRIHSYEGLIIRSRFPLDRHFLEKATSLKFIGRVGAGLENIDVAFAREKGIFLAAAPEGNRDAVGEHALGMLLALFNKLKKADLEVRRGLWDREGNRGLEVGGKTIGILGYGNTGKAFARKLSSFGAEVLCCDILEEQGDTYARQVSLSVLQEKADVLSLHLPQSALTQGIVSSAFIEAFKKPFWLLNTARGRCVNTAALVQALESKKILGAGLDVLEYEKSSFEDLFSGPALPPAFEYLLQADNVLLSPHVAGWTVESKEKMARIIAEKIQTRFAAGPD